MADCVIKASKSCEDFVGFTFNGMHCIDDLKIYRTSDGSRFQENLTPQISEQIGQHNGMDGAYFLGAQHRQKVFDIKFAFTDLSQTDIVKLQTTFAFDKMGELWFDEYPYKVWDAKVTGTPQLQVIPFDDGFGRLFYKGEGTVQFTAYYPYAHTPDYVQHKNGDLMDGRLLNAYSEFNNVEQWKDAANLWVNSPAKNEIALSGEVGGPVKITIQKTHYVGTGGVEFSMSYDDNAHKLTFESYIGIPSYELSSVTVYCYNYAGPDNQRFFYDNGKWMEYDSTVQEEYYAPMFELSNRQERQEEVKHRNWGLVKKTVVTYDAILNKGMFDEGSLMVQDVYYRNPSSYSDYIIIDSIKNGETKFVEKEVIKILDGLSIIDEDRQTALAITFDDNLAVPLSIDLKTGLLVSSCDNASNRAELYQGKIPRTIEPGRYQIQTSLSQLVPELNVAYHFWYY